MSGVKFIEKKVPVVKEMVSWLWKNRGAILLGMGVICVLGWSLYKHVSLDMECLVETVKTAVTVLVSMLGFSVSSYVFLNNSFQSRRGLNTIERQIIDEFQNKKLKSLGKTIIFAVAAIVSECLIIALTDNITHIKEKECLIVILLLVVIVITIANIITLGNFTYEVINYEDGLNKLANSEVKKYSSSQDHEKIQKGDFLNFVNNIEVLVERITRNHIHAKMSSKYDSDFKQALCDGFTESGEVTSREEFAEDYREIIEYRNLLVQTALGDSEDVAMGGQVRKFMNKLFQNYIRGELLTGISISNIRVNGAVLEKTSFSNSSFFNIRFAGDTNLKFVDFRDSNINSISFEENQIQCEGINFSNAKLINVKFDTNVDLTRAVFKNSDLTNIGKIHPSDKEGDMICFAHTNFSNANLTRLDICMANFEYADFSDVRMIDSKIGISALKENNTNFSYANMKNVDLLRAHVEKCIFDNADMETASFTYAKIKSASFENTRLSRANWTKSVVENNRFEKSYCSQMTMKSAVIKDCQFNYAIMRSVDMSGATVKNCCFDDTVCRDSLWVDTKIENSSFKRSVLANARIVGSAKDRTRIRECSFKNADLSNIAITNIEFENCNFKGADFNNARLINVRFINCKNLSRANMSQAWLTDVCKGKHGKAVFESTKDSNMEPRYVLNTKRKK